MLVSQCGRSVRNLRLPGSGRQLMKTSPLAKFESYAAKGAHRATANMGIRQSLRLRHKNQTPDMGIFIWYFVLIAFLESVVFAGRFGPPVADAPD